jgi:hypothetical protein
VYLLHEKILNHRVKLTEQLGRAIAQASHRGGPGSNTGLVMWGFVMAKSGAGASFLREL